MGAWVRAVVGACGAGSMHAWVRTGVGAWLRAGVGWCGRGLVRAWVRVLLLPDGVGACLRSGGRADVRMCTYV